MSEYPVNKVFPPDFEKYGTKYNGYKNGDIEVVLYDFAAVGYDLELTYKGKTYFFQQHYQQGVCQCFGAKDGRFSGPYGPYFKDANDLIQNFVLDDGKHIIDVLDEIEHAEAC
jgi:hypothetical protein